MPTRKPATRPGSFRPAAAVAHDLLRLAATKKRKNRPIREAVRHVRPPVVEEEVETPDAPPPKITLAPATTSGGLTDSDVGLPEDPVAQDRAERFLRAAYAFQLREAAKEAARRRLFPGPTVHEEVPNASLTLVQPTDRLTPVEAGIVAELHRIAGRKRGDDRGHAVA